MDIDAARQKLELVLDQMDHDKAVHQFAIALRDEGMSQIDLYKLFLNFQKKLDSDDSRYDSVIDTMDCIWGGPWAKGNNLYEHELTSDELE